MIQEGLLWFDDSKMRTLADKIKLAVEHYQQKNHCDPDVCYISPATFGAYSIKVEIVRVLPAKSIMPNYFWLGIAAKKAK